MSYVQMQWNREAGRENISRTTTAMLVCPNWTVSNKFNLLPGRTADSDDWLEPNEQFELTLCPQEGVPPYRTFAIVFSPDGVAVPLSTTRTFPFNIQPAMNLG